MAFSLLLVGGETLHRLGVLPRIRMGVDVLAVLGCLAHGGLLLFDEPLSLEFADYAIRLGFVVGVAFGAVRLALRVNVVVFTFTIPKAIVSLYHGRLLEFGIRACGMAGSDLAPHQQTGTFAIGLVVGC